MMQNIRIVAAIVALVFVVVILLTAYLAIWNQSEAIEDWLTLTELVISWPVAAAGFVFGGGQAIIRAWRKP